VLRKSLKDARKAHDLILIDCPPALGLLTINGLVAADWALISSEAQYFALQGVEGALEVIEQAREFYNPDLEWLGVVLNIADMRTVHSRQAYAQLKEHFPDKVFDTTIRSSIAYAESAEKARSILDHRPDLGADYLALAEEVLGRIGLEAERKRLRPMLAEFRVA
jgi:chromosome partitioning protein